MKLIFNNGHGEVDNGTDAWNINTLPALGFACEGVFYDDFRDIYLKYVGGGQDFLSYPERNSIAAWLTTSTPPGP